MILNLKVDPDDRVWLLWCSSLRAESKTGKIVKPTTPPKGFEAKPYVIHQEPMRIEMKPNVISLYYISIVTKQYSFRCKNQCLTC